MFKSPSTCQVTKGPPKNWQNQGFVTGAIISNLASVDLHICISESDTTVPLPGAEPQHCRLLRAIPHRSGSINSPSEFCGGME